MLRVALLMMGSLVVSCLGVLGSELLSVHRLVWCFRRHFRHRCLDVQVLTLCRPKQLKQRFLCFTNSLRAWLSAITLQSLGEWDPLQNTQER